MGNLVDTIASVEEKINKLLQQQDLLRKTNRDLKLHISKQETKLSGLQDEIELLERDNQSLKTANAMLGSNDHKRETKLKINSLIREIDQCIVQLSE